MEAKYYILNILHVHVETAHVGHPMMSYTVKLLPNCAPSCTDHLQLIRSEPLERSLRKAVRNGGKMNTIDRFHM